MINGYNYVFPQYTKHDPPLPPLDKPDFITILDLSPEDRARAVIIPGNPSGFTLDGKSYKAVDQLPPLKNRGSHQNVC